MAGGDRVHFVTVIFLLKCQPNYMGRLVAIFFGILKFCAHPRRVWFSNWRRKWWCSMMMMNIPIRYGHIVWYIDTQDNIGAHEYWISSTKDKKQNIDETVLACCWAGYVFRTHKRMTLLLLTQKSIALSPSSRSHSFNSLRAVDRWETMSRARDLSHSHARRCALIFLYFFHERKTTKSFQHNFS